MQLGQGSSQQDLKRQRWVADVLESFSVVFASRKSLIEVSPLLVQHIVASSASSMPQPWQGQQVACRSHGKVMPHAPSLHALKHAGQDSSTQAGAQND